MVNLDAVLYGLQSFWEGVDIQGDALRLLSITQLPFQNISDCVMKARKRAIARQTGNEWALRPDRPELHTTLRPS